MLNQTQKTFLSHFGWNIEISNLKEIVEPNNTENIYFLAWGKEKTKRNTDSDIIEKNYFLMDFDIRNFFREQGDEITDDEIIEIGNDLGLFLNNHPKYWFNQWRFIVFTGNGLHLYYVWDSLKVPEDITPREYSAGVSRIYEEFANHLKCEYLVPDPMCKNIGRIARLPDTINQKTGKKAFILKEQNETSVLVSRLPQYGKRQIELETEFNNLLAKKYALLAKEELLKWADKSLLEAILKYPVETLLMESGKVEITWFVNGKNFIDPRDKSYYGFYKSNDGNYIVVGGSTTLSPYADGRDGLNPFHLVQGLYGLDNAWVYKFFTNKLWKS